MEGAARSRPFLAPVTWCHAALSCVLLAALALGASLRPAQAHAVLLASEPADDARLEQPPGRVVLRFSEPVVPIELRMLAPDGSDLSPLEPGITGAELVLGLPPELADGTYLVSYRVTSLDSHPVFGSIAFTVGGAPGVRASAEPAPTHDAFWRTATLCVRTLLYAVLLATAGLGLCQALLLVPPAVAARVRRAAAALAAAGSALAVAFAGVSGGALLGGPPAVLLSLRPWAIALGTPIGATVIVAMLGLLLLACGLRRGNRAVPLAGALLVAASFALSGHDRTAAASWLTLPTITATPPARPCGSAHCGPCCSACASCPPPRRRPFSPTSRAGR
jgi:copper transport protein